LIRAAWRSHVSEPEFAEAPMISPVSTPSAMTTEPAARLQPPKRWRAKFGVALKGIKLGIRGQSSFSVHFFFAALTVAASIVLSCTLVEWCLLLGCIGFVLTAELFNSALETLFRGLNDETKSLVCPSLDIAAGAVLLASIGAAVIGAIVFLPKLGALLN
jgi:diacylglycerol kinase